MSQRQPSLFPDPPRPGAYSQEDTSMSSRRLEKHARRSASPFGHLEAASRHMPPPKMGQTIEIPGGQPGQQWDNGHYYGLIRRYETGCPIGGGPYAVISLTAADESARHDWREFQELKNHLVGPEWEALEIYPAESRLVDPSNRFFLWCMPAGTIPWGATLGHRDVRHPAQAQAPQRPFPAPTNGDR